ncbi:hypothetical protein ABIA45_000951 [Bradyrhizobium sp. USDA 336]
MFGFTCMPLCKFFVATFRTVDRGCPAAPGLPCALFQLRVSKARASPPRGCEGVSANEMSVAERRRRHLLRHCERSEAIQSLSADAVLDCFAALAMTMLRQYRAEHRSRAPDAAQRLPGDAKHRPVGRCAAEPGPMLQRVLQPAGSRLCNASLTRCVASGTPRTKPACPYTASMPSSRRRPGTPGRSHTKPRRSPGTVPSPRARAAVPAA